MPWNGESQDKRTDGDGTEISRPGNTERFFPQRQGWEIYKSSRHPPIPLPTAIYSAPIDQAKESRATCASY